VAIRKDGVQSSEKLLKAAMAVFAEKGYKKTTVAEVCKRAGCNVAAVNYHFRSKEKLYAAVWKNAFEEAMKVYPPDGGLPADAPAEQKLRALIRSHLHRILDDGKLGCSGQILLREMVEPTEVIQQIFHDTIAPLRKRTHEIISELLGPSATQQDLRFCELSVVHQFLAMGFRKSREKRCPLFGSHNLTMDVINQLAEHITLFSLAGIAAVREKTESMPKKDLY
jgi:AcrR family transcriptional regulator